MNQKDYTTCHPESDVDREFFTDLYQDRSKKEGYDVYPEEAIHRTKKTNARKRECYNEREYNSTQCSQNSLGVYASSLINLWLTLQRTAFSYPTQALVSCWVA